jgi:hypothetical protein
MMPMSLFVDTNGHCAITGGAGGLNNVRCSDTTDIVLGRLSTEQNHKGGEISWGVHRYDGTRH